MMERKQAVSSSSKTVVYTKAEELLWWNKNPVIAHQKWQICIINRHDVGISVPTPIEMTLLHRFYFKKWCNLVETYFSTSVLKLKAPNATVNVSWIHSVRKTICFHMLECIISSLCWVLLLLFLQKILNSKIVKHYVRLSITCKLHCCLLSHG